MAKKRKFRTSRIFILLLCLILVGVGLFFAFKFISRLTMKIVDNKSTAYLGSNGPNIQLYDLEFTEKSTLVRGTEVLLYDNEVKQIIPNETKTKKDDTEVIYRKIEYNKTNYLIKPSDVVKTHEESVYEKEKFVRTSLTLYEKSDDVKILGNAKKGTKLEITGFDKILDNGNVNMYKVKNGEIEAYAYSKYLVNTEEDALANYNENGTYDYHKERKYSYELYGGYASNLDYYPYEKVAFEDNKFVDNAKAYYLVGTSYVLNVVDEYIKVAKSAGATAFVVDIKDGALAYKSSVAQTYSPTSFNHGMNSVEAYKIAIDKIKAAGFYVIGRIVLFNDPDYAKDHPEDCIYTNSGTSTSWVSAYSRKAWEFNVRIAKEAIELFDFNEIQYDYARFPEASFNWSKKNYDFKNTYSEEKAQAIQTFLYYATDEIHKTNTYLSVDVFGECSGKYVTAYGQYWPAISNIVDAVSGMPYTDHFDRNNSDYWNKPYNTLYNWGLTAAARQKEIPTPAKVRTWITAYNTPYWKVTNIYGANEIYSQVKGLADAGLGSGFITWNANSNIEKYKAIAPAFSKEY